MKTDFKYDNITSLADLITEARRCVSVIFNPSEEQLEKFQHSFSEIAADEILTGVVYGEVKGKDAYGFHSAGNAITSNMGNALIASGISANGTIPEDRVFGVTLLPIDGNLLLDAQILKEEMAFVSEKNSVLKK